MKDVRLAIAGHFGSFHKRILDYCNEKAIPYKNISCLESDIMSQLSSVDVLLWLWQLETPAAALAARHIIHSAELMGVEVFPNTATCWSYDDKLAQKYQLEAVQAPLVPTYVFYDQQSAMDWVETASFPKVFKLKRGAGSKNVILVENAHKARILVKQAFKKGFNPTGRHVRELIHRFAVTSPQQRKVILGKIKRIPERLKHLRKVNREMGRECGYIYFQDFVPENKFDTRITVIGNHTAFGFTRNVRKNDFRASGSGDINYDMGRIKPECLRIALDTAKNLGTQSIAFDFLIGSDGKPLIGEISYDYVVSAVYDCPGHWDSNMQWHEGHIWPSDLVLDDIMERARRKLAESI